jgi:hypothetical protein
MFIRWALPYGAAAEMAARPPTIRPVVAVVGLLLALLMSFRGNYFRQSLSVRRLEHRALVRC